MEMKMIGSKIAEARKKINISQAELAERLFISPQAVGKWERGESIPDIITVNRLAEIFGVDLNYFSGNAPSAADETAFKMASDGIAGIEQTGAQATNESGSQELMNFSGSNLQGSDFSGVTAPKRKFNGSALRGADFSGADLTGSSFVGSDISETNFDRTNLTDCTFSANDLAGASFNETILVRTQFRSSALNDAKFTNASLIDVMLTKTDLRKTVFQNCVFNGVVFKYSDLSGVCFDKQTFTGVKFQSTSLHEATFHGATLRNVSFRATYALTNRFYRTLQTIRFDGATMDKLTYAALKGVGVDLSKVTII
ncbi:pentapeptide repeat-containing protein [Mucilaginibacter sabulilitoris]|uniref:Pentapeptide repeat-containing protein n=1 Tax=Mucilaginibacter sabulilitoris TaxID=1173583 RepID=A0ABZ0TGA4_9SPHI|nr:pentapeptide repeat-containing protein [Mucilaginibacter sabulilitoris]WPU92216.1 pentapeptide repeat-containing protein [Mucilaginibacter sabulilitoris]